MRAVLRWLWVLILVFGLVSLAFGIIDVIYARSLQSEALGSYGRYMAGLPQGVNTWDDIEAAKDKFKAMKEGEENELGQAMGFLEAGQAFDTENKTPAEVTFGSYGTGADTKVGYIALVDGATAYGMGMLMYGMYMDLLFSGILHIIIGVALVVIGVVFFGMGRGISQLGAGLTAIAAKVFPPAEEAPAEES